MEVSDEALRYLADVIVRAELGHKVSTEGVAIIMSLSGQPKIALMLNQAWARRGPGPAPSAETKR